MVSKRRTCSVCGSIGHRARRTDSGYVCPRGRSRGDAPPAIAAAVDACGRNRRHVVYFETLADALEHARKPTLGEYPQHANRCDAFTGYTTRAAAIDMLAGAGCPELAARVRELAIDMLPMVRPVPALGEAFDVSGAQVDVARFLEGDPECMVDYSSPSGTARTLDVYIGIGAWHGYAASVIEARGAAVCAMVDALETTGTRVRLSWVSTSQCRRTGNVIQTSGLLKDYHAPLDIDLIAFVLAHPAMLRQVEFAYMEQWEGFTIACRMGGHGIPIQAEVPQGAIYVPSMVAEAHYAWEGNELAAVQRIFKGGSL